MGLSSLPPKAPMDHRCITVRLALLAGLLASAAPSLAQTNCPTVKDINAIAAPFHSNPSADRIGPGNRH